jgi:hypothetical protein
MTNENTDFALKNENEEWEKAEFWEADPMQSEPALCDIILYVNWEEKTATVETRMKTNSTNGAVWNGLASEFTIPEDTDFEEFAEHYKENIQPLLQEIGAKFESFWDGSNWKGRFIFENVDAYGEWSKIENVLLDSPKHDKYYYFDVRDSFQSYSDIIDLLGYSNINFMDSDLDNDAVLDNIIDALENEDVVYVNHSREDYRTELKLMQETLKEEAEEEN